MPVNVKTGEDVSVATESEMTALTARVTAVESELQALKLGDIGISEMSIVLALADGSSKTLKFVPAPSA